MQYIDDKEVLCGGFSAIGDIPQTDVALVRVDTRRRPFLRWLPMAAGSSSRRWLVADVKAEKLDLKAVETMLKASKSAKAKDVKAFKDAKETKTAVLDICGVSAAEYVAAGGTLG